jgi:hypothetical protein
MIVFSRPLMPDVELIAFELTAKSSRRRENPVQPRLCNAKNAIFERLKRGFPFGRDLRRPTQTQSALCVNMPRYVMCISGQLKRNQLHEFEVPRDTYIHMYVHVCIYTYIRTYASIYVNIVHRYTYVHRRVYIYIHTHIHIYIYT